MEYDQRPFPGLFCLKKQSSKVSYKTFSWPILLKIKKFENWQFFDESHGLTRLEKCQFFDFF